MFFKVEKMFFTYTLHKQLKQGFRSDAIEEPEQFLK